MSAESSMPIIYGKKGVFGGFHIIKRQFIDIGSGKLELYEERLGSINRKGICRPPNLSQLVMGYSRICCVDSQVRIRLDLAKLETDD